MTNGQLTGSNRQFIEDEILHIGSLLSTNLAEVIQESEVVLIETQDADETLLRLLRADQIILDLAKLGRSPRNCRQELLKETLR